MLLGTAGGEFDTWFCCCRCILIPSPFGHSPYRCATPRNAAGHGRGEFDTWFCCCLCFLPPPSSGHLPYVLLRKTQRRRVRCIPLSLLLRFYIRHLVRLLGTAGEEFDTWFCCCLCFLTPPSSGHLPYILLRKTQRRRVRCISLSLLLRFYTWHPAMLRGTAGEECRNLTITLLYCFLTPPSLRATSPIFCDAKHRGGVLKYLR